MIRSILHICTGYSIDFQGGITNYVRNIAKVQAQNGIAVYVLTDSGKDDGYHVISIKPKNHSFSFYKKQDKNLLSQILDLLEKHNFDLIHVHMMLNLDQRICDLLEGRKYIVSLHDYFYICPRIQMVRLKELRCERCSEKCYKCFNILEKYRLVFRIARKLSNQTLVTKFPVPDKSIYKAWITRNKKLLENARYLLPVSNRVREIYCNSGIEGNYKVLHIGNLTAAEFDSSYEYSPKEHIDLVILSTVSEIKGGKLICEMLKKVHNPLLRVHFFGRTYGEEDEMMQAAGILNHGPYQQNDLKRILSDMDMGIMVPIWEDNGPQVVMEMINNHLPVFATRMGGIPDFVNEKNGFLFDPFDEDEVARGVEFLNQLSIDQIAVFKKNITPTKTPVEHYHELMSVYQDVLNA